MRPSSGSRKVLLAVALILVGCSSKSKDGQGSGPVTGGDAGVNRGLAKLDADNRDTRTAGLALDVSVSEVPRDGAPNGQGETGDAPSVVVPSITVEVDPQSLVPGRDGGVTEPLIVPSTYGPSPFVTVTVVSHSGDLKVDEISSVTAAIIDPALATPLSITKLAKSDTRITPESNTMRFIFSGVPLDLSKLASASYDIVFTATTVGGSTGQIKVTLAVDTGPVLTVVLPVEGGYYKGSAPIDVQVTQAKFAITQVTMALGQGEPTPLTNLGSGNYKGNIDFAAFSPPLEGAQLATFRAINENGTEATVQRKFVSDNTGPTISGTSPAMGDIIGNVITIKATIDDPAGVDRTSVIAIVGNGDQNFEVTLVPKEGTKLYTSLFDTTKLPSYALYPTISFRARDLLGNESTTSYMLSLDNEPPLLDLDPSYVRVIRESDGQCSWRFDPVGPDAVDDGQLVPQIFDVRARIEDRGNKPLTGDADFVPIGGIDYATVKLYVLGTAKHPLVVDTTDPPDGYCDDINPELVPTTKPETDLDAQVLDMLPIATQGTPDYTWDPGAGCSIKDQAATVVPKPFCNTTENFSKALGDNLGRAHSDSMTYVIPYAVQKLPAIYTLGPIVADKVQCAGRQFDSSNNLKNGWACLAAKASDKQGNTQVSRPIRVCILANPEQGGCEEFQALARLIPADPLEITTSKPLLAGGAPIAAGAEVFISGVISDPYANGQWQVDPLDASGTRFSLRGATGRKPSMCVCDPRYPDDCKEISPCPVNPLTLQLTAGQPIVVETALSHGFDQPGTNPPPTVRIMIHGNTEQYDVQGVPWVIKVIDATHFSLVGSSATEPLPPGGNVRADAAMPDCTGTLIKGGADGGRPLVDSSKRCKPWTMKGAFVHP